MIKRDVVLLPLVGRGKEAWFRARDSLLVAVADPLRFAPAGNDSEVTLRLKLGVIPGERSEGRGSGAG